MAVEMESLAQVAADIGAQVAAPAADAVDREGRFPHETVTELRRRGMLGALVPPEFGGPGASVTELAAAVTELAQHCGSSALILAMHGIQVAALVRHGERSMLDELTPRLLRGELLLANANSEAGLGGERRRSICALEPTGGGFRLEKQAATVSYGEYADGILATARRSPDSPPGDQVLAVCLRPELSVHATGDWDTLGMRGTCSRACRIEADIGPDMVLNDFATVFARTALPVSTLLLSSVWLGLAEAAAARAHRAVRSQARRLRQDDPAAAPPTSALRLAELGVLLQQLREVLGGGGRAWDRAADSDEVVTPAFSAYMDNVKLSASTLVSDIAGRALAICGLAGYRNDSDLSLGRLSRDAAAAPLMVNNDRALMAMAHTLLIRKQL